MNFRKHLINLCFLPILCVIPLFGSVSCADAEASGLATDGYDYVKERVEELPENAKIAAPYIQEDLEILWHNVAGNVEVYAADLGIEEPPHPLAEANEFRDKLISGASFEELVAEVYENITPQDLRNMPSDDLKALNGILPFDVDLSTCGETLADVLNSLDIGQVSAVLRSEDGFHVIQLLNREGGRLRIGHVIFEIAPVSETTAPENDRASSDTPYEAAMKKMNWAMENYSAPASDEPYEVHSDESVQPEEELSALELAIRKLQAYIGHGYDVEVNEGNTE